jgi:hypothetical protein
MLDTQQLEMDLLTIFEDMATRVDDPGRARRDHARDLAAAITRFMRTGRATGPITTTGTAAAQTGQASLPIT